MQYHNIQYQQRINKTKSLRFKIFFYIIVISILSIGITKLAPVIHSIELPLSSGTTLLTNDSENWSQDTTVTKPSFNIVPSTTISIAKQFQSYYNKHSGLTSLGKPITEGYNTQEGFIQFFQFDALLIPENNPSTGKTTQADDQIASIEHQVISTDGSNIIRIPLIQALLNVGSTAKVSSNASIDFTDLRNMTSQKSLISLSNSDRNNGHFITEQNTNNQQMGHQIPDVIWNYINNSSISDSNWKDDIGAPLTEALKFTAQINGTKHNMLIQVFDQRAVVTELDSTNNNTTQIYSGNIFLNTLGYPTPDLLNNSKAWLTGSTNLMDSPNGTNTIISLPVNYPLNLTGETSIINGQLWYAVNVNLLPSNEVLWVISDNITFTKPNLSSIQESMSLISPSLNSTLQNLGNNVGVEVYDVDNGVYFSYNGNNSFLAASSIKVPIMLSVLDMVEKDNRSLTASETSNMKAMIEYSNNDSTTALFDEIGGVSGLNKYLNDIGVSGISTAKAWGDSTITPQSMVSILTKLYQGNILNYSDRTFALSLMEDVEEGEQIGVGDTAPSYATVAMKDGWVTDNNNLWVVNSSGIVTSKYGTIIISIYTDNQDTLEDGQELVQTIATSIAQSLE